MRAFESFELAVQHKLHVLGRPGDADMSYRPQGASTRLPRRRDS